MLGNLKEGIFYVFENGKEAVVIMSSHPWKFVTVISVMCTLTLTSMAI